MIHQIFCSPHQTASLDDCLQVAVAGDILIFLQDGVLIAESARWAERLAGFSVYVLEDDIAARAVTPCFGIPISSDGWVELIATHQSPVSWF